MESGRGACVSDVDMARLWRAASSEQHWFWVLGATMTTTTTDGACGEFAGDASKYEFPRSLGAVDLAGEKLKYNIAKINA